MCKEIREKWVFAQKNHPVDTHTTDTIREHMESCSSCRMFICDRKLSEFLREKRCEGIPEPSHSFFADLQKRIAVAKEEGSTVFADVFSRVGLRLAPVMAALFICLSCSFAYVYKKVTENTIQYTIEEIIFCNDSRIGTEILLINTSPEEM
jgi:hypothetical protein